MSDPTGPQPSESSFAPHGRAREGDHFWNGERVAITGRLASMTRDRAKEWLASIGAEYVSSVTRMTSVLVVGEEGWPLKSDGRLTRKLVAAKLEQRRGSNLRIVAEQQFLIETGLEDIHAQTCGTVSLSQLARVVEIPVASLKKLVRAEVLKPAELRASVPYFAFHQIAGLRTLLRLQKSGVSLKTVRRSLQQLRPWYAHLEESLNQIADWHGRGLAIRTADGGLSEPTGQRLFDFDDTGEEPVVALPRPEEDLFARALELEDGHQFAEASTVYEELLASEGPDADVYFNLANCRYYLNDLEQAALRFRQAVDVDPNHAHGWNNLGNVLAEQGHPLEAVKALRTALALDSASSDVHYSLAMTLDELGQTVDARSHWKAYLRLESCGEWADFARDRLMATAE